MKTRILRRGKDDSGYSLLQALLETLCVLLVVLGMVTAYTGLMKKASGIFEKETEYIRTENAEVIHEIGG